MRQPLFILSIALFGFSLTASAAEFKVQSVSIDDQKAVLATVEPVKMITARARIGGIVVVLKATEGMMVEAGTDLAVVVDDKLALQIKAIDARIESQDAQRAKTELDLNRINELFQRGTASQAQVDQAKTAFDVANRQLSAIKSDRDVILQQTAEGTVRANGQGRVLTVPVAEGSVVMPGETIATIAEDNYILRVELPERHARFMRSGDKVKIAGRGAANGDQEILKTGTVRIVYPEIKGGRVVADIAVDQLGDYFVGERTRVYVSTGTRQAIVVPISVVFLRAGIEYVRLKDGREIVIKSGERRDDKVEVLSGLATGDMVVTP
jgi:RND family efflux transporter MFP subunit